MLSRPSLGDAERKRPWRALSMAFLISYGFLNRHAETRERTLTPLCDDGDDLLPKGQRNRPIHRAAAGLKLAKAQRRSRPRRHPQQDRPTLSQKTMHRHFRSW